MLANYEEFRQIIIQHYVDDKSGFISLQNADASIRVALSEFITGVKHTPIQATYVSLIQQLAIHTGLLKHKDELKAIVHKDIYEQILNYNARQLNIGKPKIKLNKHQEEIIEHILGKTEASTQTISIPTRASEIGQTPEYKKNRANFLKVLHHPNPQYIDEKDVSFGFTAKDLLTEARGTPLANPDWLLEMTEENKDKFSRQPYERSRLSFEELISKFTNGREKYETDAFFNHCIKILLGGLSQLELIDILFQHIDRQNEQITDLLKNQPIVIRQSPLDLRTVFNGGLKIETGKDRK